MSDIIFNSIISTILANEGDYVNDPFDKGGETKYGISKASYPNIDITNLSLEQAKALYKQDYWDKQGYCVIQDIDLATKVLDLAVNTGSKNSIKLLQRALRACGAYEVIDDGIYGNKTTEAINNIDNSKIIVGLRSEAAGYYRGITKKDPSQKVFLTGWLNRAYE